jgi:hypothetical protein
MRAVLPPASLHTLTLQGTPTAAGALTVRGLLVQAVGGAPREFVLPLATPEEDESKSRRRSALQCEQGRAKYAGLGAHGRKRASGAGGKLVRRYLECNVVPDQPSMRIRWSSLAHGALMLYEGEQCVLTCARLVPRGAD